MNIFKKPIDEIKVGERARVELGNIEELKTSIERRGLFHPIIIDDDSMLVAGYRRLTCCRDLGFKEIDVRLKKDLSDIEKLEIEMEENLHKELTWDEKAVLRAKMHALKQEIHGKSIPGHKSDGWSLEDTADDLAVSIGTLSQDIKLAEALTKLPSLKSFVSKRQALKALTKVKETAILAELARRDAEKTGDSDVPYIMHKGESLAFLKNKIEDETIDLVIFDPPWGIDIDVIGTARGLSGEKTSYDDDSLANAKNFMEKILPEIYRVMKQNTHFYMFIGVQHAHYWVDYLSNIKLIMEYGKEPKYEVFEENRDWAFDVRRVPLVWVKEGGGFTDFDAKFMPRYEILLFCNKGLRRLNSVCSDVFEFKRPLSVERIHTQQKPIDLLQLFIRLSSVSNEIVLDPCAGSFAVNVAATLLGRRSIGIEKNEDNYNKGLEWIRRTEFGSSIADDKEKV
jgi:DNA modification methylase